MDLRQKFMAIPIGFDLGQREIVIDDAMVNERLSLLQWQAFSIVDQGNLPPGATIDQHPKMKFQAMPQLKAAIWAKSEHEFLNPFKIGSKLTIKGKVVRKYEKRGKFHVVCEYETMDETGRVLMRSRETGVHVE